MTISQETDQSDMRKQAITQLKKRRDFGVHLLIYFLVNGFFVLLWAMTNLHGFFWPVIPIVLWGIGIILNAWDTYRRAGFTEKQIDREMRHLRTR